MNVFLKKLRHIFIEIILIVKEKTFRANMTRIKYLLFTGSRESLVIVFSAYSEKPLYNYVRTLKKINATRLYIKDDFGVNGKGSYYLGEKGRNNVESTVCDLINRQIKKMGGGVKKLVFVGSSKGGYAALNFASMYDNSIAIVGAPQYLLGRHLIHDRLFLIMDDILGTRDETEVLKLDSHIKNRYQNDNKKQNQKIYMQYSDREYTYELHIKELIEDIKKTNIELYLETLHYENHSDVHKFFPAYLNKIISTIL